MLTATNNSKIDISTKESIKALAENLTSYLIKGSTVCLHGEIGVGKTTLVKNFINIKQKKNNLPLTEVTSPTFNLLNEYEISDLVIRHYDLYRLKFKSEINNLDLYNIGNDTITFIEWPELIEKKKLFKNLDLIFSYENNLNNRSVKILGLT
tara:strand:+ start:322 stop:777 length:456 start_codon:yes stop_codon:yes gene_type:complete